MRPDMHHLLVERGHAWKHWGCKLPKGWRTDHRFRAEEDRDEESFIAPRFRPAFSENLSPLYRYLDAQVGRPWNKVYGEIRARVNADTAVQYHILQHLYDRIAVKVRQEADGSLWHHPEWGRSQPLEQAWRLHLYVCPRTGLIRRIKPQRTMRRVDEPMDNLPATGPDHEYRALGGQWYEVWWDTTTRDGEPVRFIARKRQLGYKELRRLGLRD